MLDLASAKHTDIADDSCMWQEKKKIWDAPAEKPNKGL